MAARRCETCGGWVTPPTQCKPCRQAYEGGRSRGRGRREEYAGNWRYNSQQLRLEWIILHGFNCPGWTMPNHPGRPPHPAYDLVVDHDLGVLCRQCNSHKAATHDRGRSKKTAPPENNHPE